MVTDKQRYNDINTQLNKLDIEKDLQKIRYQGRSYLVEICSEDSKDPKEYFETQDVNGAYVRVSKDVPLDFKKPVIAIQILEADLFLYNEIEKTKAQVRAREIGRKLARSSLDTKAFEEYKKNY